MDWQLYMYTTVHQRARRRRFQPLVHDSADASEGLPPISLSIMLRRK